MNIIQKLLLLLLFILFVSCKNTSKQSELKKETINSKVILPSKKIKEEYDLNNMIFFSVENNNNNWILNDFCGGGAQRIKFTKEKIYYYKPIEEIPYSIISFKKNDTKFVYKVISDYSKKNKQYIFEFNSNSGILSLQDDAKLIFFIDQKNINKITYKRTKCEDCYDKIDCDKWRKEGSLKENAPFGYPE